MAGLSDNIRSSYSVYPKAASKEVMLNKPLSGQFIKITKPNRKQRRAEEKLRRSPTEEKAPR